MSPIHTEEVDLPVGFAGLSTMVSDVDALLTAAKREALPSIPPVDNRSTTTQPPPTTSHAERPDLSPTPSGALPWPFPFGWAVGALILFVFGTMIYSEATKPSVIPTTSPRPAPKPAPKANPVPVPEPSLPYTEEKPPIEEGHILTRAQLQYCLAENIRLEAAQSLVHDTDNYRAVRQFNDLIDDYNSRCAHARYHRSVMETAQQAVERERSTIEGQGVERFHAVGNQSRRPAQSPADHQRDTREQSYPVMSLPAEREDESRSSSLDQDSTVTDRADAGQEAAIPTPAPVSSPRSDADLTDTAERAKNLKECLDGRYPRLCDHSLLTHSEAEEVAAAERSGNLKQCLTGKYPSLCNHEPLTREQARDVEEAERSEMFAVCMDGRYPALCTEAILTPAQRSAIRTAHTQRGVSGE